MQRNLRGQTVKKLAVVVYIEISPVKMTGVFQPRNMVVRLPNNAQASDK